MVLIESFQVRKIDLQLFAIFPWTETDPALLNIDAWQMRNDIHGGDRDC